MRDLLHKLIAANRANNISRKAANKYDEVVGACAKVSEAHRGLSFNVHKITPFNWPRVEQIDKPKVVVLSEGVNFVTIKDGKIYKLDVS